MSHRHWSVDAELHNGVQAKTYRNDPYRARGRVFYFDDSDLAAAPRDEMPEGTRHTTLWGRVSFVPYPATEFRPASPTPPAEGELVRVFVGQLPYFVTDMQLAWLCHTFGGGSAVFYPERIMKKQPNGERLPTGCIHAWVAPEAVEAMAAGMHKRMLVDDTGVWHAQTRDEFDVLKEYIADMKVNKHHRVPNRPYDSVVVQLAVSTFVPMKPMPLTDFPVERGANKHHGHRSAGRSAQRSPAANSPQPEVESHHQSGSVAAAAAAPPRYEEAAYW